MLSSKLCTLKVLNVISNAFKSSKPKGDISVQRNDNFEILGYEQIVVDEWAVSVVIWCWLPFFFSPQLEWNVGTVNHPGSVINKWAVPLSNTRCSHTLLLQTSSVRAVNHIFFSLVIFLKSKKKNKHFKSDQYISLTGAALKGMEGATALSWVFPSGTAQTFLGH